MAEYNNGYKYQIVLTNKICEEMFSSAFLISLRIVKLVHVFFSLVSIFAIIYFMAKCRKCLKFHFNVKILFYFQFLACFLESTSTLSIQTYQIVDIITAKEPCDVVLSPGVYQFFSVTGIFSFLCTNVSLILMFFERSMAALFFGYYEDVSKKPGIALLVLSVLIPLSLDYYVFHDITFDYPQMNAMSTDPGNVSRITVLFATFIAIGIFTSILSVYLYFFNNKRIKSLNSQKSLKLSSRYQLCENLTSSRILWQLTSSQFSIYLIYGVSISLIRLFIPKPRPAIWQVIGELLYIPPLYCAMMPLLCIFTIRNSEKTRNQKIKGLITMKSTGNEGWDNYQKVLQSQWD